MDNSIIIEKIKKLLALSASDNEHEAAAAAEKARGLLEAYDLTMLDLQEKPENVEERYYGKSFGTLPVWVFQLSGIVARHFNCEVLSHSAWDGKHLRFIGTPTDTAVAEYVFEFLKRTIETMAAKQPTPSGMNTRRFRESFKYGAMCGIAAKLKDMRKAQAHTTPTAAATQARAGELVLIKRDAVSTYLKDKYPKIKAAQGRYHPHANGFYEGREAGQNISINPAVNQHNGVKAIGE